MLELRNAKIILMVLAALLFNPLFAQESCQQLQQHYHFLITHQKVLEKIANGENIPSQELRPIENFYRKEQKNKDMFILLENLDSEGLSRGQVTFTAREASAWWLLREEFDQTRSDQQLKKLQSFLFNQSWWNQNLTQSLISLRNQLQQCSSSCVKESSSEVPLQDLQMQMERVNAVILEGELKRYQNHLELKNLPSEKSFSLTPRTQIGPPHTEAFSEIERRQQKLNELNNQATVKLYYQSNGPNPFVIIDKLKKRLFVYQKERLLFSQEVQSHVDDDSANGGAGLYQLEKWNAQSLLLLDQRGRALIIQLKQNWVLCDESESCREGFGSTPASIQNQIKAGVTPITVIPSHDNLEFIVKNGQLAFTTYEKGIAYSRYNFSPKERKAIPIKSVITKKEFNTIAARIFLQTLDREKEHLMEMYQLDNDEYNQLLRLSFAIMGQESKFGTHWRYHVKESLPVGVAYLKRWKALMKKSYENLKSEDLSDALKTYIKERFDLEKDLLTGGVDVSSNSRGPTQIKKVPTKIAQRYGVTKESLANPEHAALATLGFLAEAMEELRAKEKFHPDINGRNRIHYLHYIYMGKSYEIVKGTATPEKNIYYQNLQQYLKGIEIYQEIP